MANKEQSTVIDLINQDAYQAMVEDSFKKPVFLLKHSTKCPYSAVAWKYFRQFARESSGVLFRRVLVIENRELSQFIAHQSGIPHQSPQLLLFKNGKVVWHAYRGKINPKAMNSVLNELID